MPTKAELPFADASDDLDVGTHAELMCEQRLRLRHEGEFVPFESDVDRPGRNLPES